tara:strand:+ start:807 stop:971 length:165 start_codon:yes stop_codon:yes gene_type:complete
MSKIIKITTGEAAFILEQEFEDEKKAEEGQEPTTETVNAISIKVDNIKYRKKDE